MRCDIPASTTLALIALPMDSAGFRSSGSTRVSFLVTRGNLRLESRSWRKSTHLSLFLSFSLFLSAHLSHLHSPYPVSAPRGLSRSGTSPKRRIDTEIFSVERREEEVGVLDGQQCLELVRRDRNRFVYSERLASLFG